VRTETLRYETSTILILVVFNKPPGFGLGP